MFAPRIVVGMSWVVLLVVSATVAASEPPRAFADSQDDATASDVQARDAGTGEATVSDSRDGDAAISSGAAKIDTTISDATASDAKARRPAVKRQSFGGKVDLASFTSASAAAVAKTAPLNLPTYTFGGTEIWGDELFYGKWRIQRNVLTNHCRLLDPDNLRHLRAVHGAA